jgi:hypothetical protein
MRQITKVEPNSAGLQRCTKCRGRTPYVARVETRDYTQNFDLPCGHSWSDEPQLTPEELAVALLMMGGV